MMMASFSSVADTIASFPILEVQDEYPLWKKISYTSVNWANENKKGIIFGVFIGGLFLSLISYLQFHSVAVELWKPYTVSC